MFVTPDLKRVLLIAAAMGTLAVSSRASISGNYSLSTNTTFTSGVGTFSIGSSSANTLNLGTKTATFTGSGNFQINSKIIGSGNVVIDIGSSHTIAYESGNTYYGLTTVKSGTLVLDSPSGSDNGVAGDLYIGGGSSQAIVTRETYDNRELIGDNSTITLAKNGVLKFNRGTGCNSDSVENFGKLILNGGTLLNTSEVFLPTVAHMGSLTLSANSVMDLGLWMSVIVDDVGQSTWNPSAILTIKNWSILEPVYFGDISDQQLSQIRFETSEGIKTAKSVLGGFIIPGPVVPEAPVWYTVALIGGMAGLLELKRFASRRPAV